MRNIVQVAELSVTNSEDELLLENINFNVTKGEICQLVGLSNFQYDVLFNLLYGKLKPDTGQIVLTGRNIVRVKNRKRNELLKEKVSFVPKDFTLPQKKTIKETLEFKLIILGQKYERDQRIEEVMRDLELNDLAGYRPNEMNHVERIKAILGVALINGPQLLIYQNPFNELNVQQEKEIVATFTDLVESSGLTVFLLSHELKSNESAVRTIEL